MLPRSRTCPLHHRRLNRREAENAAENIGDEYGACRRSVAIAGVAHQRAVETALGMNDHRIGGTPGLRARLAVTGDRAINQTRIDLAKCLVSKPQPVHNAWPKILDQNI